MQLTRKPVASSSSSANASTVPANSTVATPPAASSSAVGAAASASPAAAPLPAAEATSSVAAAQPAPDTELAAALRKLVSSNERKLARVGLETLVKVINNIVNNPEELKYLKIKQGNAKFNAKLGGLPGGKECILAIGFVDGGEGSFELVRSATAWEKLVASKDSINFAIGALGPATPSTGPAPTAPQGGIPMPNPVMPMMGANAIPGLDPASVANMMSNPAMLQQMLNNPAVSQMMQGNPMLRQMTEQMMRDPAALQSMMSNPMVQSMMSDPAAMQQAAAMLRSGNTSGMMPSPFSMNAGAPTAFQTPQQQQQQQQNQGNSEDDDIAEAIRRSMEDN